MSTNKKGGYKIIDLKGIDLRDGGTISGIYESIEGSYRKPILLTGIVIDEVEKNDVFVIPTLSGYDFVFENIYGLDITINDENEISSESHDRIKLIQVNEIGTITKAQADEYVLHVSKGGLLIFAGENIMNITLYNKDALEDYAYLILKSSIYGGEEKSLQYLEQISYVVNSDGELTPNLVEL